MEYSPHIHAMGPVRPIATLSECQEKLPQKKEGNPRPPFRGQAWPTLKFRKLGYSRVLSGTNGSCQDQSCPPER
eukprot:scaffold1182_cov165-Amphora_coffeaeformis.AAC.16